MTRDEFLKLAEDAGLPVLFRGYTVSHTDGAAMYRGMRADREVFLQKMGEIFDQLRTPAPNGAPPKKAPYQ